MMIDQNTVHIIRTEVSLTSTQVFPVNEHPQTIDVVGLSVTGV